MPWADGERALLLQNCAEKGADKWEQRAYELKLAGFTYRDADAVERAYGRFIVAERARLAIEARATAMAEAARQQAAADEAERNRNAAEAQRLFRLGTAAMKNMQWQQAHDALLPASALAPEDEEIRAALADAAVQYEALREVEERRRHEEAEIERKASKESHPMQWAVFQQIDRSGAGLLQTEEIVAYMAELGQEEMSRELVRALDQDGDGNVDFAEFCQGWERWLAQNTVGANNSRARRSL